MKNCRNGFSSRAVRQREDDLAKVREFTNRVASSDSADAKKSVHNTGAIPPNVILHLRELGKIQTEVNQIREEILVRYRKVLSGNISAKVTCL